VHRGGGATKKSIAFIGAGSMKWLKSHDVLKADPKMGWANDFSNGFVKFKGTLRVSNKRLQLVGVFAWSGSRRIVRLGIVHVRQLNSACGFSLVGGS